MWYGMRHLGDMGGHSVFVIDLAQQKHVATLNLWPYYRPHGLTVDAQGRLFVMSEAHNLLLRFSDPAKVHVPDLAVPSGGYKTHLFALTKDAQTAYALNLLSNTVTKIRPNDPTFAPVAMVPGPVPEGNVLSADESLLYVANRGDDSIVAIDTASMTVVAKGKTRRDPNRVYRFRGAQGQDLLLTTNSGEHSLSVFGTDLQEQRCFALPSNPLALSFHPVDRAVYISFQDDTVRRLDLDSFEFGQQIKTLREPDSSYVWRH
jgi:YVTN family beta-propeller protein